MSTTYIQDGDVIDGFIAPTGGVVKDVPVIIGAMFVVPQETVAQTETFLGAVCGVHGPFVKDTSSAAVVGAAAFYDPADGKFYAAASPTRYIVGTFAQASDSSAATCYVKLEGVPQTVYGVPGDIQGVTAGTGLTGGGTTGTVTVALSAGSIASLALADTAMQATKTTTAGLTAAAGATQDVDVTIAGATSSSKPVAGINAYAGTGLPIVLKAVGATGKVTVTIANIHAAAALNATADITVHC